MAAATGEMTSSRADEHTVRPTRSSLAGLRAMADRAPSSREPQAGRCVANPGMSLADAGSPCSSKRAEPDRPARPRLATASRGVLPRGTALPPARARIRRRTCAPPGCSLMGHPPFMVRPAGARPRAAARGHGHQVRHAAGLAGFDRVLAAGYPVPESPAPASLLGGPTRFWLACADGEPVATAMSHTGHGVVDVEAVATLPGHRGRGIGTAVTWAATLAEPQLPAILIASDDGVGSYRRMVFRWRAGRSGSGPGDRSPRRGPGALLRGAGWMGLVSG